MKKVIFFDCFGVIVNEIAVSWFKKHYNEEEAIKLKDEIFVPADRGDLSEDEAYKMMAKGINTSYLDVKKDWYNNIYPNEELANFISKLNKEYDVYLLSNAISSYVRTLLDKFNLINLFKKVYISSEIKLIKPNKDFFEFVLRDLNLDASQCVMIDDTPTNIDSAISVGLHGIVYKNNKQLIDELLEFLK